MPDLLIELFSEEVPARMQTRAAKDLQKLVTDGLVEAGLTYAGAAAFATPRRLTLTVQGLTSESPTLREEKRGPRVDAPDKAIEGFLRGAGITRDQAETVEDKKGTFLLARIEKPGRTADAITAEVLEATIRNFPWPKSMRWGAGTLRWVRPLRRILCILTDESGHRTVPLSVDGIDSGDVTEGHRFMAPGAFSVVSFDDYAAKLKRAKVVLDAQERSEAIWQEATNMAFASGLELVEDPGLLAEVAGLVEWPVPLMGEIDAAFLDLPPEVLQTSMKEHQKFFSVRNPKTGRIERFVTVANIETADQGATILAGNRKVLSARLADAAFFWENDLRIAKGEGLSTWVDRLGNVTFHNKLGSQKDRVVRIAALAQSLAPTVGADPALARQAAEVAKADLSSEMVYEFPELQGLMGRYYAEAAGLPAPVAAACEAHYSPLGPSDAVPTEPVSVAVALADKLDTLTGFWAIDEKPTGSKDPYALRRAALGVIRLCLENGLRLDLNDRLEDGLAAHSTPVFEATKRKWIQELTDALETGQEVQAFLDAKGNPSVRSSAVEELNSYRNLDDQKSKLEQFVSDILNQQKSINWRGEQVPRRDNLLSFFHDRLKVYMRDQGIPHDVIDACLAMPGNDDLTLLVARAKTLAAFLKTDDGENLLQGFKRANNILTQAEEKDGVEYSYGADAKFAEQDEELALFDALDAAEAKIAPAMQAEDFATAMTAMAALRAPVDAFFEAVQVNTDNQIVRRNRLNLLSRIRAVCSQVADLTKLD